MQLLRHIFQTRDSIVKDPYGLQRSAATYYRLNALGTVRPLKRGICFDNGPCGSFSLKAFPGISGIWC